MNIDIRLDATLKSPIYQQVADQIKLLIASGRLKQGDRLPTIREMAGALGVNRNTVAKAFRTLQQENVIVARPHAGTTVAINADDQAIGSERRKRLTKILGDDMLKALSLGYSPEEIDASFHVQLARWHEQKQQATEEIEPQWTEALDDHTIRLIGSNDLALDVLIDLFNRQHPGTKIEMINVGSLGGLIALYGGSAHLAGVHLLDEETGEYNLPYIKRILPGTPVAVVHLVDRIQGLMFRRGNPKQIKWIADLARPDVSFVNRQKGAGTRVLLDINLRRLGIPAAKVKGYDREVDTHISAGLCVARGEADVALGIAAAARGCGLEFLPLFRERYDFVMPRANYQRKAFIPLLKTMASNEYRAVIDKMGGYDTTETGRVHYL